MRFPCLHELFEAQAIRHPDRPAVISNEGDLTYAQLNRQANQLAHYLITRGVTPETMVGLCVERSPRMLVGLLAVLKAGGAYVPIDPEHPVSRWKWMLEDADVSIVVTDRGLKQRLPELRAAQVLDLDAAQRSIALEPTHNPNSGLRPDNLVYCIYTSGSTGRPKGVAVAGRSVVNQVTHMAAALNLQPADRVLQFTSISIDAALEEIFPAWSRGAAVVMRPKELTPASGLMHLLRRLRVSVVSLPSVFWEQWVDALSRSPEQRPDALRLVFVGGERIQTAELRRWMALPWSNEVTWIADYGPTEATISCSTFDGPVNGDCHYVPIGKPISNTAIYILDPQLSPVPIGVTGELYVSGVGLARGYWKQYGLTAQRFVPDPLAGCGRRMYRTGDMGRMLPDGNIQFIGRTDDQIKILGHRIELGEVQAAVRSCDGVRDAVVIAHERETGPTQLIAYVVADEFSEIATVRRLRETLPAIMIPSCFVVLDRLPVSPVTAKIERDLLPAPRQHVPADLSGATEAERLIAKLFQDVAGCVPRSLDDSFFMCGGDSLRALRLLGWLTDAAAIEVSFVEFRRSQSVRALAALLEQRWSGSREDLLACLRNGPRQHAMPQGRSAANRHPASRAQQRMWFLNNMQQGTPTYSVPFGYRIRGNLSVGKLDAALTQIVARHHALRSSLVEVDGKLWQDIAPPLPVRSRLAQVDTWERALQLARAEAAKPFDLSQAPLFRSLCIALGGQEYLLLLNFHHAIFDAWSLGIFWRELCLLYESGGTVTLQAPVFQYADYVGWQTHWLDGAEADRQRTFWRDRLHGELPILRLNPDAALASDCLSAHGELQHLSLDSELYGAIRRLAHALATTDFVIALAAFLVMLHRHTLQEQIIVGVPVACRSWRQSESIIGCITNTVALRINFRPGLSFRELVDETSRTLSEAISNQELPFDAIVDALPLSRQANSNPVFQAMFVMQSTPMDEALHIDSLQIEEIAVHSGTAKVDLTCSLRHTAAGLEGELECSARVLGKDFPRWSGLYETVLSQAVHNATAPVSELALLSAAEQAAMIARATANFETYRDLSPLHVGFEARARRNPDAIAIEAEGCAVRYGELNARANHLARALAERGAAPERRIGVCIERSIDQVVALLAVLKSGAAFVPLDPTQPIERIRAITQDAELLLVLAQEKHRPVLAALPVPILSEPRGCSATADFNVPVSLDNAAYLYYTSGSTGRPKGVLIEHRCAMNRLAWLGRRYGLRAGDRVIHKTPLVFDVAIWEIFGTLHAGATILMAAAGCEADAGHIRDLLAVNKVVFAHFVPSMLDAYLGAVKSQPYQHLRWVQVSGESMPAGVLDRFCTHFDAEFHSLYGQTETSEVAAWEGRAAAKLGVPIGRQIGIYRLHVLDGSLNPVPPGVQGELCVAGCGGLARGYQGNPALTAEKFVPNPYAIVAGERLYRTGDLACVDGDGLIWYRGRIDDQTKIRGCRVETGEVAATIARHPSVRSCAVIARSDETGVNELVAYIVGDRTAAADVATSAARFLPRYMLPAHYVYLAAVPLTPSGKLDRSALPPPEPLQPTSSETYQAPRGPLEQQLADLWKAVLGIDHVGRTDDFFSIGGNSLKCNQVVSRVNTAFEIKLSVRDFFTTPTIEALALMIERTMVEMVSSLPDDEVECRLERLGT